MTNFIYKYQEYYTDKTKECKFKDYWVSEYDNRIPTHDYAYMLLSEGYLPNAVAASLGVPKRIVDNWLNPSHADYQEEFSRLWELGLQNCHVYHSNVALMESKRRGFNFKGYQELVSMELEPWRNHMKDIKETDTDKTITEQILAGISRK